MSAELSSSIRDPQLGRKNPSVGENEKEGAQPVTRYRNTDLKTVKINSAQFG